MPSQSCFTQLSKEVDRSVELYGSLCCTCEGSGWVAYYRSRDPVEQALEVEAGTVELEECPQCFGESTFWFDSEQNEWLRKRD